MDTDHARAVLKAHLGLYRSFPYADLVRRIDHSETEEISRAQGEFWQVEIQFFWDDVPGNNIRVIGSIDDGGPTAYMPLCESFIKSPEGRFIGE
ncbi:hypothetical protein [Lignipirellula cremea]|uniref:Uncharacterized protein n=1 Tax=Lignipirellula cremea TaxID=2528010 RepID=A0A518DQ98_9BACT|nr:hypothetical protein [Lignipirellula cremea]QDU94017.1 hypothetical protein Pla8534_18030 [Lignipirellula cremea]